MERTHALDRWLYRGNRPNRLARLINGVSARLAARGIGPAQLVMLEVTGRRTGKTISFPVVVADYQNERYLVSMLGEDTSWVRNVRAAGGHAVLRFSAITRLDAAGADGPGDSSPQRARCPGADPAGAQRAAGRLQR